MGLFMYFTCTLLALASTRANEHGHDDGPKERINFGLPTGNLLDLYNNKEGKKPKLVAFKYENCGSPNDKVKLDALEIIPQEDGDAIVTFSGKSDIDITSPIKAELTLQKSIFGVMVKIPCFQLMGSCTYDDICEFGMEKCPFPVLDENKIPCSCPASKGQYTITKGKFPVPRIPTADLLSGEYQGKVIFKSGNDDILACYNGTATLEAIEVP